MTRDFALEHEAADLENWLRNLPPGTPFCIVRAVGERLEKVRKLLAKRLPA